MAKKAKAKATAVLGYRTTQVTKPLMIDELAQTLRETLTLHDAETIAEPRTFTRDAQGKMSGSPFDDRTISLAIANQMLKHVWLPEYQIDTGPPPGTFEWWQLQVYDDGLTLSNMTTRRSLPKSREPIGKHFVRSERR